MPIDATQAGPLPPLYVRGDGGADRRPLGEETVIQLGRPANLILEPEQLPGQVQARIGKEGPRRNDMSAAQEVFVGIDVSKEWFDVAVRPGQECWRGSQDEAGVATLTRRLQQLRPRLVIMEASGGYERLIAAALGASGLPIAVVNPRQVRDFARSLGKLAKTDRIDAEVIAHFGQAADVEPRPLPSAAALELEALVTRRRQVVRMRVSEQVRRQQALPVVQVRIDRVLALLKQELKEIDDDLSKRLRESPVWREQEELLPQRPRRRPYTHLHSSSPSEDYLTVLAGQRQWTATTNFAGCPGRPPDSFANSAVLTTSAKVPDALGWPIDPCFPVQIDPKAEQFEQVVACAYQRPFAVHLLQSPQQELPESPALLDLAEYRLHSLHPQSVALPTPPGL